MIVTYFKKKNHPIQQTGNKFRENINQMLFRPWVTDFFEMLILTRTSFIIPMYKRQ